MVRRERLLAVTRRYNVGMEGSATGQSSAAAAQPDPAENQVKDLPPEKFDSDRDARMRFFHDVAVTQLSERYNAPIDSLERAAWTQARALAVLSCAQ
jgi:hypothetical protein